MFWYILQTNFKDHFDTRGCIWISQNIIHRLWTMIVQVISWSKMLHASRKKQQGGGGGLSFCQKDNDFSLGGGYNCSQTRFK